MQIKLSLKCAIICLKKDVIYNDRRKKLWRHISWLVKKDVGQAGAYQIMCTASIHWTISKMKRFSTETTTIHCVTSLTMRCVDEAASMQREAELNNNSRELLHQCKHSQTNKYIQANDGNKDNNIENVCLALA
jgi:hypothetical protein